MSKPYFLALILGLAAVSNAQLTDQKAGEWKISVAYPVFRARSETARRANSTARLREKRTFLSFLDRARREMPDLKKLGSAATYELLVQPTITLDTSNICSGYVTSYYFTAGAHGSTSFEAINVGPTGRPIRLESLFAKGVDGARQASYAIIEKMLSTGEASYIQDGTWIGLAPEEAENFVLTRTGIRFLFPNYSLGSYAEGTFEVDIPYSKLSGLDRSGPFAKLFKTTSQSLVGPTWVLDRIAYNNDDILRPDGMGEYEVRFTVDGHLNGVGGRNRVVGSFTDKNGQLTLSKVASTRMADAAGSIAATFRKELGRVRSYLFRDGLLVLTLPFDTGVMVFHQK